MLIVEDCIFFMLILLLIIYSVCFMLLQDYENCEINWFGLTFIFFMALIVFQLGKNRYQFSCFLLILLLIALHESCFSIVMNEFSSYTDFGYKFNLKLKNILSCTLIILFLWYINFKLKTLIISMLFIFLSFLSVFEMLNFCHFSIIKNKKNNLKALLVYAVPVFYHLLLAICFSIN